MKDITRNLDKKIKNQNPDPQDPQDYDFLVAARKIKVKKLEHYCVSNKTHKLMCKHDLISFIGDEPIANMDLICTPCRWELKEEYGDAVNYNEFSRSYEIYEDIYIERQVNKIATCGMCDCDISNNNNDDKKLEQILLDLETYLGEKIHSPVLKTGVQCLEFLRKQAGGIVAFKEEIEIKFPNRHFTLEDECMAINTIMNEMHGKLSINFKDHKIVIKESI